MAIQINASGSREGVLKHVDDLSIPAEDPSSVMLPSLKAFIKSEVDSIPSEFNGCTITCQGIVERGLRRVDLNIIAQKFHLA